MLAIGEDDHSIDSRIQAMATPTVILVKTSPVLGAERARAAHSAECAGQPSPLAALDQDDA